MKSLQYMLIIKYWMHLSSQQLDIDPIITIKWKMKNLNTRINILKLKPWILKISQTNQS